MLLVYTHKLTNRVRYTFKQVFTQILGLPVRFTTDVDEFKAYIGTKLSYSFAKVDDEPFFKSHHLLFEKGVKEIDTSPKMYDDLLGLYQVNNSAFPFDPFAATFFMLSRYEEYLPYSPDQHGRFSMSQSLVNKPDWLLKPWVDIWAFAIKDLLLKRFPNANFVEREFKFVSTIDVDQAYAYKHKGFLRSVGTMSKQLLSFNTRDLLHQFKVLLTRSTDPFNSFDDLLQWHREKGLELKFFFHVGDYGVYDQSIAWTHQAFRLQVKSVADYCNIGLHPSYNASFSAARTQGEKRRLEQMVHREISESRQHFIRLKFPETFRLLLDLEIKKDYSLIYPSHPGFRAGTCTPFPFYDLLYEVPTKLQLHPTAIMDGNFKNYMKVSPEEAKQIVSTVVANVKAVNGELVSLWHNNSVTDYGEWRGWKAVFMHLLDEVS